VGLSFAVGTFAGFAMVAGLAGVGEALGGGEAGATVAAGAGATAGVVTAAGAAGVIALTAARQEGDNFAAFCRRQFKASAPPGVTPEQFAMKSERQFERMALVCAAEGCCCACA